MADTNTTNLNLVLPEVGASSDTWGTKINSDLTAIDNLFTTGPALLVSKGGTSATTAADARTNLAVPGTGVSNTFTANQIISVTDNTNAALRITQLGTGDAIRVEDSTNPDSTPFIVDTNGVVVSGHTAALSTMGANLAAFTPQIQAAGASVALSSVGMFNYTANGNNSNLAFSKSRSGTTGTQSLVSSGDGLGSITFQGSDGTGFIQAALIQAAVDGTPGTNDMPGRLVFSTTADGASSPTERMRIDSSGNITATGTLSMGSSFLRNRIINGDMRIDQRNAGASVTINAPVNTYTLDRWFGVGQATDGVFTIARSAVGLVGFTNALLATVTTADASIGATQVYAVVQKLEGNNVSDLAFGTASARTITVSFWAYSSIAGTFGGALANEAHNRSYPFTYTISAANTWEYKTVTIAGDTTGTWPTDNASAMRLIFSIGAGSSRKGTAGAWAAATLWSATGTSDHISTLSSVIYITGVQLEPGSIATPFERRQYGQELALCQRYYEKGACFFQAPSTGNSGAYIPFKVTKRTSATMSYASISYTGTSSLSDQSGYVDRAEGFAINYTVTSASGYLSFNWTAPAEL